jgi:phosphomevalonate kinase
MKENKIDYHSCSGYITLAKTNEEMNIKIIKLQQLHKENKEDIDELKQRNKEELKLLQEIVTELKDQFVGFKQAVNILKYSALTLVIGVLISQLGLLETIKMVLGL